MLYLMSLYDAQCVAYIMQICTTWIENESYQMWLGITKAVFLIEVNPILSSKFNPITIKTWINCIVSNVRF